MTDRRRSPRYVLSAPLAAEAMPMHDAIVEQLSGSRLVVITLAPQAVDEALIVHVTTSDGLESRRATVVSSNPVSISGSVHFRIEMRLDGPPADHQGAKR